MSLNKESFELFSPWRKWPESWPCFYWEDIRIGPETSSSFRLDSQKHDFTKCFKEIYPELTFIELIRVYFLYEKKIDLNWLDFFKSYSVHFNEFEKDFFKTVFNTPFEFQKWAYEKKVYRKDLLPLRSIKNLEDIKDLLNFISSNKLSKSEGAYLLELGVEVYLIKKNLQFDFSKNFNELKDEFYKIKYPMTSERSKKLDESLKKIDWPHQIKACFQRQGDEQFLKLELKISKKEELEKITESLKKLSKEIKEALQIKWN